jgi:hypothetical protein
MQVGDFAEFLGFRFEPAAACPGEKTWMVLWWRAMRPAPPDLWMHLQMLDSNHRPVGEALLAPAPALPPGDFLEERRLLRIPAGAPAPSYLAVGLSVFPRSHPERRVAIRQLATGSAVQTALLSPLRVRGKGAWPPEGIERRTLRFGSEMYLKGVRVGRMTLPLAQDSSRGAALRASLYWSSGWSGSLIREERIVALELLDRAGQVVARERNQSGEGWYSTSLWLPGEEIEEAREILLPADLPAGRYRLRLRVTSSQGEIPPRGDPIVAGLDLP